MSFAILPLGLATAQEARSTDLRCKHHDHGQGTSLCGTFKGKLRLTCNPAKKAPNESLAHLRR